MKCSILCLFDMSATSVAWSFTVAFKIIFQISKLFFFMHFFYVILILLLQSVYPLNTQMNYKRSLYFIFLSFCFSVHRNLRYVIKYMRYENMRMCDKVDQSVQRITINYDELKS